MDFFAFLSTWFWYVMAFAAGGLVAWLVARQFIRAETPEEAIEDALDARFDEHDEEHPRRSGEGHDGLRGRDDEAEPRAPRERAGAGGRFASLRRGASSLGGRR